MGATDSFPGTSGRVEGKTHLFPIRVNYHDTDFSGVVHHANYIVFCERARAEALRTQDVDHNAMVDSAAQPVVFAVKRLEADYIAPAKIDDLLVVKTRMTLIKGARMGLIQEVTCNDKTLMTLNILLVILDEKGRPCRLPSVFAEKFKVYESEEDAASA